MALVEEKMIIALIDQSTGSWCELTKGLTNDHKASRQPGGVDKRDEVTGFFERGGVVVVVEKTAITFEMLERVEGDGEPVDGLLSGDEAEIESGRDGEAVHPDVRDIGVIANMGGVGSDRWPPKFNAIERQPMCLVGQRIDAMPGIKREALKKGPVVHRKALPLYQEGRWPAGEPLSKACPRSGFSSSLVLPQQFLFGNHLIAGDLSLMARFDEAYVSQLVEPSEGAKVSGCCV